MSVQILNDELEERILQIARREQRSPTEVIDAALRLYEQHPQKRPGVQALLSLAGQGVSGEDEVSEREEEIVAVGFPAPSNGRSTGEMNGVSGPPDEADEASDMTCLLSIAGIGRSGQSNVGTDADAILAAEIDPKRGWSLRRDDGESSD